MGRFAIGYQDPKRPAVFHVLAHARTETAAKVKMAVLNIPSDAFKERDSSGRR